MPRGAPDGPEGVAPLYEWVETQTHLFVSAPTRKGLTAADLELNARAGSVECLVDGVATPWCGRLVGKIIPSKCALTTVPGFGAGMAAAAAAAADGAAAASTEEEAELFQLEEEMGGTYPYPIDWRGVQVSEVALELLLKSGWLERDEDDFFLACWLDENVWQGRCFC